MSVRGRIHSTESFGTVDGPGVRFVVFMQGCPLRCLYCHNPDTWDFQGGQEMTAEEILKKYDGVKEFLKNGGLTVSGGEPLVQSEFVSELFKLCQGKGIHTALDTSGITFSPENTEKVDDVLKYTNLVMLDIKHINDSEHKKLTGHSNKNILAFAKYLEKKEIPVWIRHVTVPGITYKEEYLTRLGEFLAGLKNIKALDVLPYHTAGKIKYDNLGIDYPLKDTKPLSKEEAINAREIILKAMKIK